MPDLVRDIMETDVHTVSARISLSDLDQAFLKERVGALPVLAPDGSLQGIVSRSDVVRHLSFAQSLAEVAADAFREQADEDWTEESLESIGAAVGHRITSLRAGDIMVRKVVTAAPDETLKQAAQRLIDHHIHHLPVIEQGRLVGMLSSFDFVSLFARRE